MSLLETVRLFCPYCGEVNEVVVDTSVPLQEYIEDCAICCRPMLLCITVGDRGEVEVSVRGENDESNAVV